MKNCRRCGKDVNRGNFCDACRVTRCRQERKRFLVECKGGVCEKCGYNKCVGALEFHHLDPKEKNYKLGSGTTRTLERDLTEIEKCILVCLNCHKEIHFRIADVA